MVVQNALRNASVSRLPPVPRALCKQGVTLELYRVETSGSRDRSSASDQQPGQSRESPPNKGSRPTYDHRLTSFGSLVGRPMFAPLSLRRAVAMFVWFCSCWVGVRQKYESVLGTNAALSLLIR